MLVVDAMALADDYPDKDWNRFACSRGHWADSNAMNDVAVAVGAAAAVEVDAGVVVVVVRVHVEDDEATVNHSIVAALF